MAENKIDEATSLKQIFQELHVENMEIIRGTVTSASPLKIQAENDEKLSIGPNNVYIPRHLTNYTTTVDVSAPKTINSSTTTSGNHSHDGGTHSGHESGNGSHSHSGGAHNHSLSTFNISGASMTVYNALKNGDKVHILSFNHGKQYYVLDRIE